MKKKEKIDDKIILLVGKSGSGKTTVSKELEKEGFKKVPSYTTRPKRTPNEGGYIFVTPDMFDGVRGTLCSYTKFDGYEYGATVQVIDQSDLFIVDPAGVAFFKDKYTGKKTPYVVFLDAPDELRKKRMIERGDSLDAVRSRLISDNKVFSDEVLKNLNANLVINVDDTKTPGDIVSEIKAGLSRKPYEVAFVVTGSLPKEADSLSADIFNEENSSGWLHCNGFTVDDAGKHVLKDGRLYYSITANHPYDAFCEALSLTEHEDFQSLEVSDIRLEHVSRGDKYWYEPELSAIAKLESNLADELVQLVDVFSTEFGWVNEEQFFIWVSWIEVYDFLKVMREIFGVTIFDDCGCGTNANIQDGFICFDMTDLLSGYGNLVEDTYPKEEYPH